MDICAITDMTERSMEQNPETTAKEKSSGNSAEIPDVVSSVTSEEMEIATQAPEDEGRGSTVRESNREAENIGPGTVRESVIYKDEEEKESVHPYFDYHDAMIQIEMLFQSHILSFGYKEYSLETYADRKFFYKWKANENCEDTDEMRAGLNIDGILRSNDPSDAEILTYVQYTLNIAELCRRSYNREEANGYDFDIRNYTELLSRIREILRRLHYEVKYVPAKEFIFLVPYDPAAEAVTEDAEDPVSAAITEYRSSSAVGQLSRKRELLLALGGMVEHYPDNYRTENSVLYNHIQFMMNHINLRHDNLSGEDRIDRVAEMSGEEMENWYDETYQMLLLRILQFENKERIERVDELAAECGSAVASISEEEMTRILNGDFDEEEEPLQKTASKTESETPPVPAAPVQPKKSSAKGYVIALIIADILFVLFILVYLFVIKGI